MSANHVEKTSQSADNKNTADDTDAQDRFVVRTLRLSGVTDDEALATAATTVWMNESVKRGGKLTERIEGVFKLIFQGKWSKSGSPTTRHAICVGQLNGAPPVGVRVRPSHD